MCSLLLFWPDCSDPAEEDLKRLAAGLETLLAIAYELWIRSI